MENHILSRPNHKSHEMITMWWNITAVHNIIHPTLAVLQSTQVLKPNVRFQLELADAKFPNSADFFSAVAYCFFRESLPCISQLTKCFCHAQHSIISEYAFVAQQTDQWSRGGGVQQTIFNTFRLYENIFLRTTVCFIRKLFCQFKNILPYL